MKAIMYHYVRQYDPRLPYFRYLDVRNFAKQLDHFEKKYGFVTKDEFRKAINDKTLGDAKGKILLTFDDAMSCHYEFVFKELKKRKLWGIFYVPSQQYQNEKILDVHRIHLLCGAFEGKKLLSLLKAHLDENMISDKKIKEFREETYTEADQINYEGISEFKRILNYFVSYEFREGLIDLVAEQLGFEFKASNFYVSVEKLKEMHRSGNIIGSHSISHPVMSKLSDIKQYAEINGSFNFLRNIGCIDTKTYCHPYGGFHSFNKTTIEALNTNNVEFSFNVEPRDISNKDLISSIQFLPRYDCNLFPFGEAS